MSVASSCGADVGVTKTIATVFSSLNCGSPTEATSVEALHAVVDPLRRLRVALDVDDDRDRAVEAGPEALGEQVVGAAARLLAWAACPGRRRRGARAPTSTPARRSAAATTGKTTRALRGDEPAPAGDERLLARRLRVVERRQERHLEPVDLVPEQRAARPAAASSRSARWSARRGRCRCPSLVTKSRPMNARPVTEIATVRPAKSTARPGRRAGLGGRVPRRQPVVEQLPEARDDEQRVVDADAEADHRDEDRRDRVDVGQARRG